MEPVWDRSSDDDLLGAARADPLAFTAFYRRHERRMLAFFLRRVGDAEVAADLTAETFAAALESSHRFRRRKEPATAWLFGIARNTLAMSRRRGRVEARVRLTRPGAEEVVVPVKENVFRIDVSRSQPVPTGAHWRDAGGKEHAIENQLFPDLPNPG